MSEIQQLYRIDRETLEGISNALKEIKQDETPINMGDIVGEIEALNINEALAEQEQLIDEIESVLDGKGLQAQENKLAKVADGTVTEITASDLEGATKIRDYVFQYCSNLTSIDIPNSVTSIGKYAFRGAGLTGIEIPDSVTSMGMYAFYQCEKITNVKFSENSQLTSISGQSFHSCISLTSINIPNSVTEIGDSAFVSCSNLTSIDIPNSVTKIGAGAFQNCTALENVNIGSGITSINSTAFRYCSAMESITINAQTAPQLSNVNAFADIPTTCVFYVKNLDSYNSTNWVAIRDQYTFVEIKEE